MTHANRRDAVIKAVFVLAAVGGLTTVYLLQRSPATPMDNWAASLPDALAKAKQEGRKVLVMFTTSPANEDEIFMAKVTLAKKENEQALADGKFITARIRLPDLDSPYARQYAIRKLPTMLLLGGDGKELNRRPGRIGEVDFRNGFLDCEKVEPRPQ